MADMTVDAAARRLKIGFELLKEYQRAAMVFAVRKVDIGLQHMAFGPSMDGDMRTVEQDGASDAIRFKLKKSIAHDV